ncbi:MAG: rod shape-determining protein RodA [Deltaproteobacteria bacterium]|nr:rod shape-determining protein RodA [Deltaproteobacteria bacterium]
MKRKILENFNWSLLWVTLSLMVIGLVNLHSALSFWGEGGGYQKLFWQQVVWFLAGFGILLVLVTMDYRLWDKLGKYFYVMTLILLVLVLLVGRDISGNRSWLGVGSFGVQPSEFAKLGIILVLAKYFSSNPMPGGYGFKDLLKPMALAGVPFILVLMEKDLGSSLFFPLIFMSMALVAKIQKKTLIGFLVLVTLGGGLAYQFGLKPYQKERIRIFMNPESDPRKSGYHLVQSKIAVGSGRIFGKGYMKGTINKLRYLPDKHTDFIFPVLAEEWGFVGAMLVLTLYGFLLWNGLGIAMKARESFGIFLATGVTALLFWHLVINLCGVLGMIPLTGVPLPFLSYGGSSSIVFLMGIGLLLNIHMRRFMF